MGKVYPRESPAGGACNLQGCGERHPGKSREDAGNHPTFRGPRRRGGGTPGAHHRGRDTMTDLIYIAVTVAFFALAFAYARACDRL
jgi:hypothetical protein